MLDLELARAGRYLSVGLAGDGSGLDCFGVGGGPGDPFDQLAGVVGAFEIVSDYPLAQGDEIGFADRCAGLDNDLGQSYNRKLWMPLRTKAAYLPG